MLRLLLGLGLVEKGRSRRCRLHLRRLVVMESGWCRFMASIGRISMSMLRRRWRARSGVWKGGARTGVGGNRGCLFGEE